MRTVRTWLILLLAVLMLGAWSAPAAADDDPAAAADGTPVLGENFATIDAAQPHQGGYVPHGSRLNAKPVGLGGGAYDHLPGSVDLSAYLPPVGDQGPIGQCVAWTISRHLMGYYANRTSAVDSPYAPLFVYLRNVASGGAPNSGLNPDAALANVQAYGVDSQDDFWQGTTNYKAAPTSQQIANAANYRITGWTRLFSGANQGVNAKTLIQQQLANNTPVAVGFPVYADFMSLGEHTLYNTTSGSSLGGHMVTAYGYNADGLYLRNQWGTGWGNGGNAHVSWAFVQSVMTGAYTISGITTPAASVPVSPQVTSLSTAKGTAGSTVTVTGAGLARATKVTFGGTNATFTQTTTNGVTKLVATVPARAAGTVGVAVTNPDGTSPDTAADDFTYPQPPPAVSGISPVAGPVAGGTTVTVTGTNLDNASAVKVGSTTVTPSSVSSTSLTFVTPARSAGPAAVQVTTPGGTSGSTTFTYTAFGVPTITTVAPNSGATTATTTVVVTGTSLSNLRSVTLGGTALSYTMVDEQTLKVFVKPRAAGTATLLITTAGGTSNGVTYTAVAPTRPMISSLSPAEGLTTGSTTVTVTGSGFTGATRVSLGGTALSYTRISDTQLRFVAPPRRAGVAAVIITGPGGSSSGRNFTYKSVLVPVLSTMSPNTGSTTGNTVTVLTGRYLTGASLVTSDTSRVSFTRLSDTQVRVTLVRRAAGSVQIKIKTSGGTSNALTFRYVPPPAPAVTSLSATTGPANQGTTITVYGTNLTGTTRVTLGGAGVKFTQVSSTQLRVTLPAAKAGVYSVVVTTSAGTSTVTAASKYTYV